MLQTILAYAGEKLAELPQIQQVAEAHAKYFTNFAVNFSREFQRRATNEVVRLRAFETDIDNVRTAMGWSEKSKKYEDVAHLSLALGLFLQQRGFQQEAQNRVETGLQAVQHSSADAIKVYSDLLCLRATLYLDKHQWAEAYKYASTALTSLDRLSQDDIEVRQGKGRTLNFLGLAATGDKQYGQARAYLTSALDCFNDTDDRTGLAIVRNNLGRIEHADVNGDKIAAEGHFQMALKLYRENADQRGLSEALTNLGVLAFDQGHLDQAWHFYKDALQLAQELQHPYGVGLTLCNLGEVAEQQGDFRRAYRLFSVAEHIFDQVASPYQQYALTAKQQVITRIEGRVPSDLQNEQYKEKPLEKLIDWALAPSGPVLQP
ncbi:MAG: tetratricopeptide repeat protein [Abitibacteriaceae bacterium]|nr:tetratricopeptide repeat protein [Abditibacteriaceae bacterium]